MRRWLFDAFYCKWLGLGWDGAWALEPIFMRGLVFVQLLLQLASDGILLLSCLRWWGDMCSCNHQKGTSGGHEDTPSYDNYCVELSWVRFIFVVVIKSDYVTLGPCAEWNQKSGGPLNLYCSLSWRNQLPTKLISFTCPVNKGNEPGQVGSKAFPKVAGVHFLAWQHKSYLYQAAPAANIPRSGGG